ncbi:LD-carboxypeptidase [Inhella sp.]|uniref:S66 peptidase family protein n=1 Tax=Inhella sp. TaxID=1921806 RepID=UPI0035B35AFB
MKALIAPLPVGAQLAVVAPAGPPREGVLAQVPGLVHQLGFRAKLYPGCHGPAHLGHLAANDAQRLADLHDALDDPEVAALLALRGGYGCIRLLPGLDLERVRRAGKPLIGYSDLTTLHGVWARCGVPAWHAPMPASDWAQPGGLADASRLAQWLKRGLWVGDEQQAPAPHALSQGQQADGILLGGNLSVLVSNLGTVAQPELRGAILFLEDISEDPYRVDRYLTQLLLAGVLDGVAGFLLGSFSEADNADAVMAERLHPLGKPVLAGWPAGHGQPNHALPLGLPVQMDVPSRTLRW